MAANKAVGYGLGIVCFALVAAMASAAQFKVGGDGGWSVPGANAESYNTWAMKNRFLIGDALVFVYPKDKDAVLLVEPASYNACNTTAYVRRFDDGDTVFTLDRSGALFFISGVEANCRANEKLIVMVLAGRNGTGEGAGAPPPSSSSSPLAPPPQAASGPPPSSSASSPPPAMSPSPPPEPAPKAPSPASGSAPPPASAMTTPSSPPPASSPPAVTPTLSPPPPPSANAPSAAGGPTNSTGTPSSSPPPAGSHDRNGGGVTAAGLAGSAAACVIGYAMLAL